jgi:hypothetical protein
MFTQVDAADSIELFEQGYDGVTGAELAKGRTLLFISPESPAHVAAGEYRSWDARCVEAFHAAGGESVAYVGEREGKALSGGSYPWGASSSRDFQDLLQARFFLDKQLDLPNWLFQRADLTVWRVILASFQDFYMIKPAEFAPDFCDFAFKIPETMLK